MAHDAGIPLIVDNTLATPYLCRPFEWGADLIVHSTTKFLGGHGDSVGGMVVESGKFDWSAGRQVPVTDRAGAGLSRPALLRDFRRFRLHDQGARRGLRDFGPTLSPMNAFLTITGIETPARAHGPALSRMR